MSSYLNCIIEEYENNKWKFVKEFNHFTGGTRDIINHHINMNYNDVITNYGLPKDIDELTKSKITNYCYDFRWVTKDQLSEIITNLNKRTKQLEKNPRFSSIDIYLEDAKLELESKDNNNKTCDKLEKIITSIAKNPTKSEKQKINGIINYLRDFYEYKSNELEEEIDIINQAIKELQYILYYIEFNDIHYDVIDYRIIFYTD